jgi:hypothetical protein
MLLHTLVKIVQTEDSAYEGWWKSSSCRRELLSLGTSIKAGITGHILDSTFHCLSESSRCVWQNVTTLAWCAK